VREEKIQPEAGLALLRNVDIEAIEALVLEPPAGTSPAARAVPASAGVSVGVAVFDPARLDAYKQKGKPVILMRDRTETTDISALADAEALVTAHGARTSHAAVVARQLGKVCLVGCQSLCIDASLRHGTLGDAEIKEGETITVDGTTGLIYRGAIPVKRVRPRELVDLAMSWSKVPHKAPRIKI
jgi:pyruvate,orthophosphate dikinase